MTEKIMKLKKELGNKLIVRVDVTDDVIELKWKYAVLCVNAEKKMLSSVFISVDKGDEETLQDLKKILIEKFNINIEGFKAWKELLSKDL